MAASLGLPVLSPRRPLRVLSPTAATDCRVRAAAASAAGHRRPSRRVHAVASATASSALALVPTDLAPAAFWATLAAISAASAWLERSTAVGRAATAPLVAMGLGCAAACAGVLPAAGAACYGAVYSGLAPLCVALLLLEADWRGLPAAASPVAAAFAVACVATLAGTALAWAVAPLPGPSGAATAAALCASYIGGTVNFVAVFAAAGGAGAAAAAAMAADNVAMAAFLALLTAWPVRDSSPWVTDSSPGRITDSSPGITDSAPGEATAATAAAAVAAAAAAAVAGGMLASAAGVPTAALAFTALAATAAGAAGTRVPDPGTRVTDPGTRVFAGAGRLGGFGLGAFFAAVGAAADPRSALAAAGPTVLFIALQLGTHLAVSLSLGQLLRLPLAASLVACNAAVGGPATAAAMAAARGWGGLVRPAVVVGTAGYVVGTPIGMLVYRVLGGG